jgi:hypothetical protein
MLTNIVQPKLVVIKIILNHFLAVCEHPEVKLTQLGVILMSLT